MPSLIFQEPCITLSKTLFTSQTSVCKDCKLGMIHQTHTTSQLYSFSGKHKLHKTYRKMFELELTATSAFYVGELAF